jgi:DNA repair exonuclease SbcCD nuclease subunit
MERLSAAGIQAHIIDGNHDPGSSTDTQEKSWACIHPSVVHIQAENTYTFKVAKGKPVVLTGFDYQTTIEKATEKLKLCMAHGKDVNILMHQMPKQSVAGDFGAWDIDLDGVANAVYCGHVHNSYSMPLAAGGTLLVVGSTHPRAIDQGSDKKCVLLTGHGAEEVPLTFRRIFRYSIQTEKEVPSFLKKLLKDIDSCKMPADKLYDPIRKPIIGLTYDPAIPGLLDKVTKLCTDKAHVVETPKFAQTTLVMNEVSEADSVSLSDIVMKSVEDKRAGKAVVKMLEEPSVFSDVLDEYVKVMNAEEADDEPLPTKSDKEDLF